MATSYFGASVGRGPVHCVLLETEDGRVVGRQVRTIDPGPYRFGRRGDLVSSGFDLLASHADRTVEASAVAVRNRRDLFAARCGAKGEVRGAEVVSHTDAVLRALRESGEIERYAVTMIADVGASETHVYTVTDGAVVTDRRSRSVVIDGPEPGIGASLAAAEFVQSVIDRDARKPQAFVLIGAGALHPGIREAVADVARASGAETVPVEEPEGVAATGAALLAADRRATAAAGTAPARLGVGIGAFSGGSVRLTAAVLPVLVLAALAAAVLAASYATGIIGPAGDSTEQSPSPSYAPASDALPETGTRLAPTSTTLRAVESQVRPSSPRETEQRTSTPVMTTFAPPPAITPVAPTTARPAPTTPTTPAPPRTTAPGTLWPTQILPWPPRTGGTTSPPTGGTTAPGAPSETATGTPNPQPSTGTAEGTRAPTESPTAPVGIAAPQGAASPTGTTAQVADGNVPAAPIRTAPAM